MHLLIGVNSAYLQCEFVQHFDFSKFLSFIHDADCIAATLIEGV